MRTAKTSGYLGLAVLLMILAGCATSGPGSSAGRTAAQTAARASAASTPASSPTAAAIPSWRLKALASKYMAIAKPANKRLDTEVDGYTDHRRDDLAVAESDLRAQAVTERWFDQHLAAIDFPPAIAAMVHALIQANQARIQLTGQQARSATVTQMGSFTRRHKAADAAVEAEVRLIRKALRLPPPSAS